MPSAKVSQDKHDTEMLRQLRNANESLRRGIAELDKVLRVDNSYLEYVHGKMQLWHGSELEYAEDSVAEIITRLAEEQSE